MASDKTPHQFVPVERPPAGRSQPVDWPWVLHQWKHSRRWSADDVETVRRLIPEGSRFAPAASDDSPRLTVRVRGEAFMRISAGFLEWKKAADAPADAEGGYTAESGCRRLNLSRRQQAGERNAKRALDYGPECPRCGLHHNGECDV